MMRVLKPALLFLPAVLADVEFLSINLKGWEGCTNDQSAKISAAWENAVKMAGALDGNIDWNEAAAVEYLGPPVYTDDYKDEIISIFKNAATFGQGSRWTPTPLKWDAYVRCDNWKGNCNTSGVKAYTENHMTDPNGKKPESDHERDTSTPVINFCPRWFKMGTLAEKIAENKNKENSQKYNLDYYVNNRDSSLLHEFMHADVITYKRNGNRHIYDMMFKLLHNPNWKKAYGPAWAKLYTRVEEVFAGGWVTQNADSFALYALAKSVQNALGKQYPYLPRPYNEEIDGTSPNFRPHTAQLNTDGSLDWASDMDGYFTTSDDTTDRNCPGTHNDAGECPQVVEVSKLVETSKYPIKYLEERNRWIQEMASMTFSKLPPDSETEGPVPENVARKCNYDEIYGTISSNINTDFAKKSIADVCKLFNEITLDATNQPLVQMHYADGGVEMFPYAAWNTGDPNCVTRGSNQISEAHCAEVFDEIIGQCPTGVETTTYGGSKVDNCIVYGFDNFWGYQRLENPRRR